MKNFKRIFIELLIAVVILFIFIGDIYTLLPNPIQLVSLKILLISIGIIHAHIIGKLLIGVKVDWTLPIMNQNGGFYARICLYIIIPICYALGG
jgi:uncharacterized membrane protein YczE